MSGACRVRIRSQALSRHGNAMTQGMNLTSVFQSRLSNCVHRIPPPLSLSFSLSPSFFSVPSILSQSAAPPSHDDNGSIRGFCTTSWLGTNQNRALVGGTSVSWPSPASPQGRYGGLASRTNAATPHYSQTTTSGKVKVSGPALRGGRHFFLFYSFL